MPLRTVGFTQNEYGVKSMTGKQTGPIMELPTQFAAELHFEHMYSSYWFATDVDTGDRYRMYPTTFADMVPRAVIKGGNVTGVWGYEGKGPVVGIKLIQTQPESSIPD